MCGDAYDLNLAMLDAAPIDDEPVTDDDRRHIEEGWQVYRMGNVVAAKDIRQLLRDAEFNEGHAEGRSSLNAL